MHYFSNLFS